MPADAVIGVTHKPGMGKKEWRTRFRKIRLSTSLPELKMGQLSQGKPNKVISDLKQIITDCFEPKTAR